MGMIAFWTCLDPEPIGRTIGNCPHCRKDVEMTVHRLRGGVGLIPVPSTEARACTLCRGLSRREGMASRVVGVAALLPLAALLVAASGTGAYILASMLATTNLLLGFATVAAILISVGAYFGRRTLRAMKMLWSDRGLIPMEGHNTRL